MAARPEAPVDLRLLAPAAAAWLTAWLAVAAPDAGLPGWLAPAVCWPIAAIVLVVAMRRRAGRTAAVALALSVAALVATTAAAGLASRADSPLAALSSSYGEGEVVVELGSAPMPARYGSRPSWQTDGPMRYRITGAAVELDGRPIARVPVVAEVPFAAPADRDGFAFGGRVVFRTRVQALPAAGRAAFRLKAVGAAVVRAPPPPWCAWAVPLRSGLSHAASRLHGDGAALLPGLAIGDVASVSTELDGAMKASSLSHLTAVSGANCAIVTAALYGLAALCRLPRSARVIVALGALAWFTVLVTPQASVVRAAAMAVAVLVAVASGRPGGGPAALGLAVIGLLVADPWYSRDYGFALSVAATAGLVLLSRPLSRALERVLPPRLALVIAVPLAAQLACQPVLVLLDPGIPTYGVAANLLAEPAAPVATVVGLVACVILPLLPSTGYALLQLAWWPSSWIAMVARGAAGLPGARLPWLPDAPGALLAAAATAAALWLLLGRRRPAGLVIAVSTGLVLALAFPVGVLVGRPTIGALTAPREWDVAVCDVGQGDAVVLRSAGEYAIVDTGRDVAALERCLDLLGVRRFALAVLTHWDADHVAAAPALAGRVDTVLHGPLDGRRSDVILDPLRRAGATEVETTAGRVGRLGDLRWRVLWPPPHAAPGNPASVVLEVDAPEYRGLFLGDLGQEAQDHLRRSRPLGRFDLVKVAHHGSADQSPELYRDLDAGVGVIGVGAHNGYGHPTAKALRMLADVGTSVLRTDRFGTILLDATPDGFRAWSERGDDGGPP